MRVNQVPIEWGVANKTRLDRVELQADISCTYRGKVISVVDPSWVKSTFNFFSGSHVCVLHAWTINEPHLPETYACQELDVRPVLKAKIAALFFFFLFFFFFAYLTSVVNTYSSLHLWRKSTCWIYLIQREVSIKYVVVFYSSLPLFFLLCTEQHC